MSSYLNHYLTGSGQHSPLGASPPFSPQYGDPTSPVSATNNGPLSPYSYDRMDMHGLDMTRSTVNNSMNMNNNNYYNSHTVKSEFDPSRNGGHHIGGINNHGYSSSVTGGKSDLASLPCSEPFSGHRLPAATHGGTGLGGPAVQGPPAGTASPPPVLKPSPQQQQLHRQQSAGLEAVSSPSPPSTASTPQPSRTSHTALNPTTAVSTLSATTTNNNKQQHRNSIDLKDGNRFDSNSKSSGQPPGLQSPGGSSKGDGEDPLESSGKSAEGGSPGQAGHSDDVNGEGGNGKSNFEVYAWMKPHFGELRNVFHRYFLASRIFCGIFVELLLNLRR